MSPEALLIIRFTKLSRYTKADNSPIVATDTQKQTIYILAKQSSFSTPEEFAAILANHFLTTYAHIHKAHTDVTVHRWTRLAVDGKPHPHAFQQDGKETRNAKVIATRQDGSRLSFDVESSIKGLTVLKSTGSAFYGFHRDEFTRLPETKDRILSTVVECTWHWDIFESLDQFREVSIGGGVDKAFEDARCITLDTFAKDESPSVQSTMYKMAEQILSAVPRVQSVDYKLPNRHYFEIGKCFDASPLCVLS